jgi:ATP-dependent DNA ligase
MSVEWNGEGKLPMLYSKTATGAVNLWECWVEGDQVVVSWGQQGGQMQSSRHTCKGKNTGRSNATSPHEQAIKEAIAKWEKQKKVKYNVDPEAAGVTERLKPMLAHSFWDHRHKLVYPATVQPKLEGVRCLAYRKRDGSIMLQSRKGDPYELQHVKDELHDWLSLHTVLDGELYVHGASQQSINSLVRRPREESRCLYYCLYDVTDTAIDMASWVNRMAWLEGLFRHMEGSFRNVWKVPSIVVQDEHGVLDLQRQFVADGYEGAIVRAHEGEYRMGYRSPHLLKVKDWVDAEFPIIGFTAGKGKFENVPIFKCLTPEGKDFDVTPIGTARERYNMLQQAPTLIGKQLTVKYFGLTEDGKPYSARGVAIRLESDR